MIENNLVEVPKDVESTLIPIPLEILKDNLKLLEDSFIKKDPFGVKRVLRKNSYIRRFLSLDDFRIAIDTWLPEDNTTLKQLHELIDLCKQVKKSSMQIDELENANLNLLEHMKNLNLDDKTIKHFEKQQEDIRTEILNTPCKKSDFPEIITYLSLIMVSKLIKLNLLDEAGKCLSNLLILDLGSSCTLDSLYLRVCSYNALILERKGKSKDYLPDALKLYRTACLRSKEPLQGVLINQILRAYCENNMIEQASYFAEKVNFPESASNNQHARYLYYMGRIHAIQLDYSLAFSKLSEAIRKSNQEVGIGFRIILYKITMIVQLLMGELPSQSFFTQSGLMQYLSPYIKLFKVVSNGSLIEYDAICKLHRSIFDKDKLFSLVTRLRNNVIRTGLRRLNISYSRISFDDICESLALDTPKSAEFASMKAIRDGIIDAVIDHENMHLISTDILDSSSTLERQDAFHKRIQYCIQIHNDAVKAKRYPPGAHKVQYQEKLEEKKTDDELLLEFEDELED